MAPYTPFPNPRASIVGIPSSNLKDQTSVSHLPHSNLRLTGHNGGLHLPDHLLGPVCAPTLPHLTAWMMVPVLSPPHQPPRLQPPTPPLACRATAEHHSAPLPEWKSIINSFLLPNKNAPDLLSGRAEALLHHPGLLESLYAEDPSCYPLAGKPSTA